MNLPYKKSTVFLLLTFVGLLFVFSCVFAQSINVPSVPKITPIKVTPISQPQPVQINPLSVPKPQPVKEPEPIKVPVIRQAQQIVVNIADAIVSAGRSVASFFADWANDLFPTPKPIKTQPIDTSPFNIKPIGP